MPSTLFIDDASRPHQTTIPPRSPSRQCGEDEFHKKGLIMSKRIWIGFVAVFVTTQVIEGLTNYFFLDPIYSAYSHIWRPIAEMKLWMLPITGLSFSFFFVFIFSKGYERKGLLEGVRYGFYVALMVALPNAYGSYAIMQIPYMLALQWFIFGTFEYVIAGAILAVIFQMKLDAPSSS